MKKHDALDGCDISLLVTISYMVRCKAFVWPLNQTLHEASDHMTG